LTSRLLPSFSKLISAGKVCESSPLGPFTLIVEPLMLTSTPEGISIGKRPTLDTYKPPNLRACLPDLAQDLTTHAHLACAAATHHALGRGEDGRTQAGQHPGDLTALGIDAA